MENLSYIITCTIAGVLTFGISVKLEKGAVFGSAIITLLSGLFLPHFFENGAALAVAATTASYSGMVAAKNVPSMVEMAAVGFITGIIFSLTASVYVGVGGRLGAIAAISCLSWIGIKRVYAMATSNEKPTSKEAGSLKMR